MNDLDKILQFLWDNKPNSFDQFDIADKVFENPDITHAHVKDFLLEIKSRKPSIIKAYRETGYGNLSVEYTNLIPHFIEQGGFTKIDQEGVAHLEYLKEKERIEFEKSKIDLELAQKMLKEYPITKWVARISFIIVIFLAILEVIRWITPS